jgi:hypothetical protein
MSRVNILRNWTLKEANPTGKVITGTADSQIETIRNIIGTDYCGNTFLGREREHAAYFALRIGRQIRVAYSCARQSGRIFLFEGHPEVFRRRDGDYLKCHSCHARLS